MNDEPSVHKTQANCTYIYQDKTKFTIDFLEVDIFAKQLNNKLSDLINCDKHDDFLEDMNSCSDDSSNNSS